MRQAIFVLISFIMFMGSSGVLVSMSKHYGGYLSGTIARRLGNMRLMPAYRPLGSRTSFSGTMTEINKDLPLGRKISETSKEYRELASKVRWGLPSMPVYSAFTMPYNKGGRRDKWFPDINISHLVKIENEKAVHIHALLSSRHDRFSDDS